MQPGGCMSFLLLIFELVVRGEARFTGALHDYSAAIQPGYNRGPSEACNHHHCNATEKCNETLSGIKDADYRGCQNRTRSGKICQEWTSQIPHPHDNIPAERIGKGLGYHNFCRNPDGDKTIWCYTTSYSLRWEYCDPRKVDEPAKPALVQALLHPEAVEDLRTPNFLQLRQMPKPTEPRLPLLELMSLNLDSWGSKHNESSGSGRQTPVVEKLIINGDGNLMQPWDEVATIGKNQFNPLAQVPQSANMFDPRSFQARPLDAALNFNQVTLSESNLTRTVITLVLASFALLFLAYLLQVYVIGGEAIPSPAPSPSQSVHATTHDRLKNMPSSWSHAYLEAEGEQKEAFELLFRCNIISTEEFANSTVTREHIQECTWIAAHMLKHKPLEQWVSSWQHAQQNFENSVAECFEARQDSSGLMGGHIGLTGRALAQRLKISKSQPISPPQHHSLPSSANLDFVDPRLDLRPLHS